MGSLKNFADQRSAVDGKVTKWLNVLGEAGFTLEEMERLDVQQARRMRQVLHPEPAQATEGEERESVPPMPRGMSDGAQLARWQWIYRHKFGMELDTATIKLPERQKKMARYLVNAAPLAKIVEVCESLFGMWFWDKPKVLGATSVRICKDGPYAVLVRDVQEVDEQNRDRRTDSFDQKDCITLEERLLFEIVYFLETGRHLDEHSWTLCGGSRYSGGRVPGVGWDFGGRSVSVGWCDAGSHTPDLAVRSAVTLEPFASNPSVS